MKNKYQIRYGVSVFKGSKKVGEKTFATQAEMWEFINEQENPCACSVAGKKGRYFNKHSKYECYSTTNDVGILKA